MYPVFLIHDRVFLLWIQQELEEEKPHHEELNDLSATTAEHRRHVNVPSAWSSNFLPYTSSCSGKETSHVLDFWK